MLEDDNEEGQVSGAESDLSVSALIPETTLQEGSGSDIEVRIEQGVKFISYGHRRTMVCTRR